MKKILGVSFAAMLAVSPMMASADDLPTITLLGNPAGTVAAESNVATTSYVKGAYNDLAGKINTDRGAINANTTAIANEATARGNADTAINNKIGDTTNLTTTEKGSLVGAINELDSAIDTLSTTASETYQLVENSTVTSEQATAHAALTAGAGVAGNLASLATAIENEATARGSADTTLQNNIDAEATARGNADTAINNKIGSAALQTTAQTLTEAINEVRTTANTANGKDTIVVYSNWNNGGTPSGAVAYTTMTAAEANAIINPQP